jgi:hypothetical protein
LRRVCVRGLCVMSEMSECEEITGGAGTGGNELARALAGKEVPGAYVAALEAGGCGLEALVSVWAAAETEEKECECACVGEVRDVAWAAGHKAVFERVKRCAGVGPWAGLEMYPWRVANAVAARCLAAVDQEGCRCDNGCKWA